MAASSTVVAGSSRSWRPLTAGILSIVVYFAARAVLEVKTLDPSLRVAAAIAPIPVFGWCLYEILRSSRDLDEMQRRIHLEALAIAYPLIFMLLLTLGLLELAIPLNKENWSYRHVWQMQGIIYLAGLTIAYRRYGVSGK